MINLLKQKHFWNKLISQNFRRVIFILFFAVITYLLFTFNKNVIRNSSNDSLVNFANLFNFSNITWKARNFAFILNLSVLVIAFIYGMFSSYRIWKYTLNSLILFVISLLFIGVSIFSIYLLIYEPLLVNSKVFILIKHSIPLLIVFSLNIVFELFILIYNRKKEPSYFNVNLNSLFGILIRFGITILGFCLLYFFIREINLSEQSKQIDLLFTNTNPHFKTMDENLNVILNRNVLYYIFGLILLLVISLTCSGYKYLYGSNKNNDSIFTLKGFVNFGAICLLATIIYGFANVSKTIVNNGILNDLKINHVYYSSFIVVALLLIILMSCALFIFKDGLKKYNINRLLITIITIALISFTLVIRILKVDDFNRSIVLLFLSIFLLIGLYLSSRIQNIKPSKSFKVLIGSLFALLSLSLFLQAIDTNMSSDNNNLLSSTFMSVIHISDILLIISLFVVVGICLYQICDWLKLIFYSKKYEINIKKSQKSKELVEHVIQK